MNKFKRYLLASAGFVLLALIVTLTGTERTTTLGQKKAVWDLNGNDAVYTAGNVGIGTMTPRSDARLDVSEHARLGSLTVDSFINGNGAVSAWGLGGEGWLGLVHADPVTFQTREWRLDIGRDTADDFSIASTATNLEPTISFFIRRTTGNIGIGTTNPSERLHVDGNILATGSITPGSSREFKRNVVPLTEDEAVEAFSQLDPVTFNYKADKSGDLQVGFIAEDVPELVATPDRKGVGPMDLVAVLTKVVQQQQHRIKTLEENLKALQQQIDRRLPVDRR